MSTPVVKLVKGSRVLDINDQSKYRLGDDFVPPPIASEPTFAQGSSSNRYDGASFISTRAANRGWSFSVNVVAASYNEMARAVSDIQTVLNWAGDSDEPLYLKYRSNSDIDHEPRWGQDGWLFYQIEHGVVSIGGGYAATNRRATNVDVRLDLVVRPYAIGLRQRLASATGGVLEDTIGAVDGQSRGLIVPEATTNKMTNPVFGHATWNNGWTSLGLTEGLNTPLEFVLFGLNSAKLVPASGGTLLYTQSINPGNTNTHTLTAYVKRQDGGVIDTDVCLLHYKGATVTPDAYESLGNGWYRLSYAAAASNASAAYGIRPVFAHGLYLAGVQLEESAYATPLAYGDMLGCAWTGTPHASTSSRTAARARIAIDYAVNFAEGAIRVVWKTPLSSTAIASNIRIFETDAIAFRLSYDQTLDTWNFNDNTNLITSSAQTFAALDVLVFHVVFESGSLKIYVNGSQIATGSTYTPPSGVSYLYIGTSNTAASHANGTFMGFDTFDNALSAAEVTADYANVAQVIADDKRVGSIPWLWSSDGDDDVANHDDTDANDDNWIVCGGIPGSAPAVTFIAAESNAASGWTTFPRMYLWLLALKDFLSPTGLINDLSGTVDANSSGGQYQSLSITTSVSDLTFAPAANLRLRYYKNLLGKEIAFLVRLYDEGSNLQLASYLMTPINLTTDYKSLTTAAAFRLFQSSFVAFQDSPPGFIDYDIEPSGFEFGIRLKRSTGTANVRLDYAMPVFRPFLILHDPATLSLSKGFYYQGDRATIYDESGAGDPFQFPLSVNGDVIEFVPERYNVLLMLIGDTTHEPTIATVLTYTRIIVTPRWSLL